MQSVFVSVKLFPDNFAATKRQEKNSPVYEENASIIAPVQVQVAHKDLKKAEKLINE